MKKLSDEEAMKMLLRNQARYRKQEGRNSDWCSRYAKAFLKTHSKLVRTKR